jgi:transposase
LAWRFLMFQKDSALVEWYRQRTENARGTRKTMTVALARKLLIALWRLVTASCRKASACGRRHGLPMMIRGGDVPL